MQHNNYNYAHNYYRTHTHLHNVMDVLCILYMHLIMLHGHHMDMTLYYTCTQHIPQPLGLPNDTPCSSLGLHNS